MNELVPMMAGTASLILRPAVLLQVLAILACAFACRLLLRRPIISRRSRNGLLVRLGCAILLGLAYLLFRGLGLADGLLLMAHELAIVSLLLDMLRLSLGRRFAPALVERFWQVAVRPLFALAAVLVVIDQIDGLEQFSSIKLLQFFGGVLTLGQLFWLLTLPYFLVVWSVLPVALVGWLTQQVVGISPSNRKALELILRYLLVGVGALWIASRIGLNTTALTAVAGGLSVGLGFGVKEVISNFVSGIWLLFEGSVRPGDVLLYEGNPCEVRSLNLRAATLWRDSDNTELVIPNQIFFTSATTTFTGTDHLRRSLVKIHAGYRHDPSEICALLERTAGSNARVLPTPPPKAYVFDYGESAVEYGVCYFIADPMSNGSIATDVRCAIWKAFRDHGVEFPLPQRVIRNAEAEA